MHKTFHYIYLSYISLLFLPVFIFFIYYLFFCLVVGKWFPYEATPSLILLLLKLCEVVLSCMHYPSSHTYSIFPYLIPLRFVSYINYLFYLNSHLFLALPNYSCWSFNIFNITYNYTWDEGGSNFRLQRTVNLLYSLWTLSFSSIARSFFCISYQLVFFFNSSKTVIFNFVFFYQLFQVFAFSSYLH